ncbi:MULTISPECIES: thioredoxin domain-containing protein [unclassified Phenylobacterium]|uniref:thioredoxin domain-containing protein n=1 Tax=unclassified Phenylobacterium TaxID=2640670 RepID=UPI0022B4CF9D|nr:thioredoxin domain-containing protein [Phenylobacterium sp. NIBR 498073]WGU41133.1 thioredoxin domain-containing protein [Phenylobacterium sp. NIBR 498073]
MRQPNRRIAVAVLGAVALCAGSALAAPPLPDDMSLGNPKAKVKLVEYASLSCTHCAVFNNEVFPAFKKKYIDTGKVHYTLREILTPPAQVAAAGYMTARCAGKDKYFTVVDAVFRGHDEMVKTGDARAVLVAAAQAGGLSEAQFEACLSDEAALQALNARVSRNAKQGEIAGTPTFVFNGVKVKEGEMTADELDAAVAAASKR